MMTIGIDLLLRYLATGEDEELVLGALPAQRDPAAVLAEARAAVDLLSPAGAGPAVQARLKALEEAVAGTIPRPDADGRAMPQMASNYDPGLVRAMESLDAPYLDLDRQTARAGRGALLLGLQDAIRVGARQSRRAGTAELRGPLVRALADVLQAKRMTPDPMARDPMEVTASDYGELKADASAARFPAGPAGTIELAHEGLPGKERLRVQLLDSTADAVPVLVTLIPADGPVAQATTDAAGSALLPWPGPGSCVLRLDGSHTVEIQLIVAL